MEKILKKFVVFLLIISCVFPVLGVAKAYKTEQLGGESEKKDFALARGKEEIEIFPGETVTREIVITNRLGSTTTFKVEVEDFLASKTPEEGTQFLEEEESPYSLKKYIKPEVNQFTLNNMERIYLPVTISIPEGTKPGGLYGAVAISAVPKHIEESVPAANPKKDQTSQKVDFVSRLAFLFLIKVKGQVNEEGFLKDFSINKNFYEKGPVNFNILYENNGNVHLDPYGSIKITNLLGKTVDEIKIDPFFVLPDSVKKITKSFNKKILFGRYKAEIKLNRGYKDKEEITDIKSISFWVIPWRLLIIVFIAMMVSIWGILAILNKYKIVKK